MLDAPAENAVFELRSMLRRGIAPRRRSMIEWAEEEIVLPNGIFERRRYRRERHPAAVMLLEAIDSAEFWRYATTGPVQDGKTLHGFVIPALYKAVEMAETIVIGGPDADTLRDKWLADFLPVMRASPRMRALLPTSGAGSKGSYTNFIQLKNGGGVRFMTGGSSDAGRAGLTASTVLITEVDKFQESIGGSQETDVITQIEARNESFRAVGRASTFLECTTTVPEGRITQEIVKRGTDSAPWLGCQQCGVWSLIERKHLVGWEDAEDEDQARENARVVCPACGALWQEEDRRAAIRDCRMVHRGQTVDSAGIVQGPVPKTSTLGYRWSDVDSLLKSIEELGALEWQGKQSENRQNAEKLLLQFHWARPYVDPDVTEKPLRVRDVLNRVCPVQAWGRSRVPVGAIFLTCGIDVGKWFLHWTVMATMPDGRRHIVDYGEWQVHSDQIPEDQAVEIALSELTEMLAEGFAPADHREPEDVPTEEMIQPTLYVIDCRWQKDAVCEFIHRTEQPTVYLGSMGFGAWEPGLGGRYHVPKMDDEDVLLDGAGWHVEAEKGYPVNSVRFDADLHKQYLQNSFRLPEDAPGSIALFFVENPVTLAKYAGQIIAEQVDAKFRPGAGIIRRFVKKKAQNHHLDSSTLARIGGEICIRSVEEENEEAESVVQNAAPPNPTAAQTDYTQTNYSPPQMQGRFRNLALER